MAEEQDSSDPMHTLIGETAAALRAAGEDRAAIITAIRRFLQAGMAIVYSPSAMWDFFGMVLHRAGSSRRTGAPASSRLSRSRCSRAAIPTHRIGRGTNVPNRSRQHTEAKRDHR